MAAVGTIHDDVPVRFTITPYSSDASPPPFKITPQTGRVPAHGTATFTVEATPVNPPAIGSGEPEEGPCYARFVADATWVLDEGKGRNRASSVTVTELATESKVSAKPSHVSSVADAGTDGGDGTVAPGESGTTDELGGAGPAGSLSRGCLVLRTHITPVEPKLHVDKRTPQGKKDSLPFIKFGVWSTHPATHPSHNRQITLTNQIPSALTFTLAVEGPFTMLNARTHAPKHPLQPRNNDVVNRPMSAGASRMFTLPHLSNIVVDMQFDAGVAQSQCVLAGATSRCPCVPHRRRSCSHVLALRLRCAFPITGTAPWPTLWTRG